MFDNQDEVLPDVSVESVNVKRRAETNDKGYSLIYNLPTQRATDVQLDHYSLPDPYMICLLYTSPSPRDGLLSRMPSSA